MTQLQRSTDAFGGTDQRWLGSREGTDTARTVTLDYAAWSAKASNGRLKGGEAIAFDVSAKTWVPYDSGGSNGTDSLSGFLLNDTPFRENGGDKVAPMMTRGRIILKYLPSAVATGATRHADTRFELLDVEA